jgi:K+-sensing histidine kinase KdpD
MKFPSLSGISTAGWVALSAIMIAAFSGFEYLTGSQLQFSVFYFIPIALLAWYVGMEFSFAAAVISAVVWWVVDFAGGRSYNMPVTGAANYTLRLASFIVLAVIIARLRKARDREQQLKAESEKLVAELQSSLTEINELRGQIQRVCAWTHRIQSEGKWVPMDQFLAEKLHLTISHGMSEEAVEQFMQESEAEGEQGPAEEGKAGIQ